MVNETVTVRQSGVRVRRSIVATERTSLVTKFAIESDRRTPIAFRFHDSIPNGVDATDLDFPADQRDGWKVTADGRLSFEGILLPHDSLILSYDIASESRIDAPAANAPMIDRVQRVDRDDAGITSGGAVSLWRSTDGVSISNLTNTAVSFDDHGDHNSCDEYALSTAGVTTVAEPARKPSADVMIAVPAYNEGSAIAQVVEQTSDYADCVLVIDDGSNDDTAERAREAGATVVEHERNKGYGGSLKTAFVEAKRRGVSHLVVIDGDGQHDPSDVPRLLSHQQATGAEIVIGSRNAGRSSIIPLYRRFGLGIINFVTNFSMGRLTPASRIGDTQSGFRAYDGQAIDTLAEDDSISDRMSASTDILYHAHRHDYVIEEAQTVVRYDVENSSSQNPLSHGYDLLSNILRTIERRYPITALGLPGFLSVFVGLMFAYLTVTDYVQYDVFPLGLAITSVFFTLVGVFACFTAIVLHSLNAHLSTPKPS